MSYNIDLNMDCGGPDPICIFDASPTWNLAPMFSEALGKEGIRGINAKSGAECIPILRSAIKHMEDDPQKYRALEPDNGWGDYDTALELLRELLSNCLRAPRATMTVR